VIRGASDAFRAAVVVTGDEVLAGRVRDENGPYVADDLIRAGCHVERIVVIGDPLGGLTATIRAQIEDGLGLLVVTGGLGPTADDRTMEAVAMAAGVPMERNEEALELVGARTRRFARATMADADIVRAQEKQALIPRGAVVLPPIGTAPGCIIEVSGTYVVVLPGPPNELRPMWAAACREGVLADLLNALASDDSRTLRLWWVSEAELMVSLLRLPKNELDRIGTYTRHGELEVVAPADIADDVRGLLDASFGDALFSVDGRQVDDIVAARLGERGETVAVAESCTGGALGARFVDRAGASAWFTGGVIAYADDVKVSALGVDPAVLASDGAVSERTAVQMAVGARRYGSADWGVSVTGIAGPGGGSDDKPVGTVWIGVAGPDGADAEVFRFPSGDRAVIRRRAVTAALHRLRLRLATAGGRPSR